jgi:hypothetical protein
MSYNLQQLQQQLQSQLDQVNQMISKPAVQPAPAQNIEAMISAAVQRQIAAMAPSVSLMTAIGAGMSEDDQRWLSTKLNGLPAFLQTSEGKEIIALTLEAYKKHHGEE